MLRIGMTLLAALLVLPTVSAQKADLEIGTWDVSYAKVGEQVPVMISVARNSDGKLVGLWSEGDDWITLPSVHFEKGTLILQKPVIVDGERTTEAIEAALDGESISGTWKSSTGLVAIHGTKRPKYKQTQFGRGRGRKEGGGGRRNLDIGALIKRVDTNGDGMLQRDEAPEQMKQFFDLMDSDNDGNVSKEEAEEALKRFQGNRN